MTTIHTLPATSQAATSPPVIAHPYRGTTIARVTSVTLDGGDVTACTTEALSTRLQRTDDRTDDRDRVARSALVVDDARWGDLVHVSSSWSRTVAGWTSHHTALAITVVDRDGTLVRDGGDGPRGSTTRLADRMLTEAWDWDDARLTLRGEHPAQPRTLVRPEPQRLINA